MSHLIAWRSGTFASVITVLVFVLLNTSVIAQDGAWQIESSILPPPAAASEQLRNSLANSPAPDPASRMLVPQTDEQCEAFVASAGAEPNGGMTLEAMAQSFGVTIDKDTIRECLFIVFFLPM